MSSSKGPTSFAHVQNDYACLIEHIGKTRHSNGKTLSEILTIDGIPFWDIFAPELAWRHLTTAVAATTLKANLKLLVKPFVLRLKNVLHLHPRDHQGCSGWPSGPMLLCLGFTPRMYRDVLQPVVDDLPADGSWRAVVLDEGSVSEPSPNPSHVLHQSIWQHWGDEPRQRAKVLKKSLWQVESVLKPETIINLLPPEYRHLSQAVQTVLYLLFRGYLPLMLPQVALAKHILGKHRPSLVLSPDTSDARTRMYALIGKGMGIPCLEVQFGLAGDESVEWRFFSAHRVAVWGEASKVALLKQSVPEEKILLTGSPRHDVLVRPPRSLVEASRRSLGLTDGRPVILLASTYTDNTHTEYARPEVLQGMKRAIFDMAAKTQEVILVVKPHPHENVEATRKLARVGQNIVFADQGADIRELIITCDAFISFGSTATIDAMIAGKLSICPIFPGWPFSEEFRKSGAVLTPQSPDQLMDIFMQIAEGKQQQLAGALAAARLAWLNHIAYKTDGLASSRIGAAALSIAGIKPSNE